MIKTIAYNDFTGYDYQQRNDQAFMFKEFQDFVNQGGNLNLNVQSDSGPLITFEEFIQKHFKDPEFFKKIVDEKMISNPFQFFFNPDTMTVTDVPGYGLYWMKNHWSKDRNNYGEQGDEFAPYILEAIKQLAKTLKDLPIESTPLVESENIRFKRHRKSNISYELLDYQQNIERTHLHPLEHIARFLDKPEVYDTILSVSPGYKKLWQTGDTMLDQEKLKHVIPISRYGHNDTALIHVFYKHDIARDYIDNSSLTGLHSLIEHAIHKNDVNFIREHSTRWSIAAIESSKPYYECFIRSSRSKEMTELLMEKGAFISGNFIQHDEVKGQDIEKNVSVITKELSVEALDSLLEKSPVISKLLKDNPDIFHYHFFKEGRSFEHVKLLVEKYDFPVQNYDMLILAKRFSQEENVMSWVLEHGADPRQCEEYIKTMVASRDDGLKSMKALHKSNILNIFYPDPIFHILNNNPTKIFLTWLEKAPQEQFNRFTVNGVPAWWGATESSMSLALSKVDNLHQLSQSGNSYAFYLASLDLRDRKAGERIEKFGPYVKKKSISSISLEGKNEIGNNIFHLIFGKKESQENVDEKFVSNILSLTQDNIAPLLVEKNHDGKEPLLYMLDINERSNMWEVKESIQHVFKHSMQELPLSHTLSNGMTVYEAFGALFKNYPEKLAELNELKVKQDFNEHLNSSLPEKESTSVKRNKL